jgi:hypothetical protein
MKLRILFLLITSLMFSALSASAQPKETREDIVQMGRDVTIEPRQTSGDIVCLGCSINVYGTVDGDVVALGGHLRVDGEVRGDVATFGTSVDVGNTGVIEKDASILGGSLNRAPGAQIHGELSQSPARGLFGTAFVSMFLLTFVGGGVLNVLLALLCWAVAGRSRVEIVAATIRQRGGLSFLAGLGVVVAAVIVITLIFSRMHPIGGWLDFALVLALLTASILGYTGLSYWIGQRLQQHGVGGVVIGAIVISFLQAIPALGGVAFFAFFMMAFGSSVLSGYGTAVNWLEETIAGDAGRPPATAAGRRQ